MNKKISLMGVILLLSSSMFAADGIITDSGLRYENALKLLNDASEKEKLSTLFHIFKKHRLQNDAVLIQQSGRNYPEFSEERNPSCRDFFAMIIDLLAKNVSVVTPRDFIDLFKAFNAIKLDDFDDGEYRISQDISLYTFYAQLIYAVDRILNRLDLHSPKPEEDSDSDEDESLAVAGMSSGGAAGGGGSSRG
jgi:hypothetical protein